MLAQRLILFMTELEHFGQFLHTCYVKELNQDLLAGRGLTNADDQVVLDKHDSIAGIYPVCDDGSIDAASSFPFMSVCSGGLFYVRKDPIDASKFARVSGFNPWH
jgi:hypothetical protein